MGRIIKIAFRVLLLLALIGVALAVAVPLLFGDRLQALAKTEIERVVHANVEFEDVGVSLFSAFPRVSMSLNGLRVTGRAPFEGTVLLGASAVEVSTPLRALFNLEEIKIERVRADALEVNLVELGDGTTNYDVFGPDDREPSHVTTELEALNLEGARITYTTPAIEVAVEDLSLRGRATLAGTAQHFDAEIPSTLVTIAQGKSKVFDRLPVRVVARAGVRSEEKDATIDTLRFEFGSLKLTGTGTVSWAAPNVDLNVRITSEPNASVQDLVALLPRSTAKGLKPFAAKGLFSLRAQAKGRLGSQGDLPPFSVEGRIRNGALRHPERPLEVRELDLDARAHHPGGPIDRLQIDVRRYRARAGESFVSGSVGISKPASKPVVDLQLDGRFEGNDIRRAVVIPNGDSLEGTLEASLRFKGTAEKVQTLTGQITAEKVAYRPADRAPVRIDRARVQLTPKATQIEQFEGLVGSSDLSVRGTASPLGAILLSNDKIRADLVVRSKQLDTKDLMGDTSGAKPEEPASIALPKNVDARAQLSVGTLTYEGVKLTHVQGRAVIRDQTLSIPSVDAGAFGGTLHVEGTLHAPEGKTPTFDLSYALRRAEFAAAFEALETVRQFAPIARALNGRFVSELRIDGALGPDLQPKLTSFDARGLLGTVDSTLRNFAPLKLLAAAIPTLSNPLPVKDVSARFTLENGTIRVSEFPFKVKGQTFHFGGSHGLEQPMRYTIRTKLPVSLLSRSALADKVSRLGLDVSGIDAVGATATLTGSIKEPKISVDVDAQELKAAIERAAKEQVTRVTEELTRRAQQILTAAQAEADRIKQKAQAAADRVVKEANVRADRLEAEAGSNPLKSIVARRAAATVRTEANNQAKRMIEEADRQAKDVMAKAEARAQSLQATP